MQASSQTFHPRQVCTISFSALPIRVPLLPYFAESHLYPVSRTKWFLHILHIQGSCTTNLSSMTREKKTKNRQCHVLLLTCTTHHGPKKAFSGKQSVVQQTIYSKPYNGKCFFLFKDDIYHCLYSISHTFQAFNISHSSRLQTNYTKTISEL